MGGTSAPSGIDAAQPADDPPFILCHGLHRQAGVADKDHVLKTRLHLARVQGDGPQERPHGAQRHAIPARILGAAVWGAFPDHLNDADNRLADVRMIEEAQIASLHRAHVVARLIVPDTLPFLSYLALRHLMVPSPGVGFGFEKPAGHHPMTFFHSRIATESKRPAFA